ncbi:MAG: hypothetical protein QF577_01415, partial [Phycisphaerae bacterium]|nr:hypothetical protein [Phycisphaerae bacterium]
GGIIQASVFLPVVSQEEQRLVLRFWIRGRCSNIIFSYGFSRAFVVRRGGGQRPMQVPYKQIPSQYANFSAVRNTAPQFPRRGRQKRA